MKKRNIRLLMVALALIPVILTIFLARNLYQRNGVPEALESLTKRLFMSEEEERKAQEDKGKAEDRAEELKSTYDALITDLKGEVESKDIKIRKFREKLEINFVDKVLFVSGSAEITSQGREILSKVGLILRRAPDKKIYIVGHTDDVPISSFLYPSNWELSTARSASVCRFLIDDFALDPTRFTAMGRAYYQPVASNATAEGRQENRRVEIIIADFPGLEGESGQMEMRSPTGDPAKSVKERDIEAGSGVKKPAGAKPAAGTGGFFNDALSGDKAGAPGKDAAGSAPSATAEPAPKAPEVSGAQGAPEPARESASEPASASAPAPSGEAASQTASPADQGASPASGATESSAATSASPESGNAGDAGAAATPSATSVPIVQPDLPAPPDAKDEGAAASSPTAPSTPSAPPAQSGQETSAAPSSGSSAHSAPPAPPVMPAPGAPAN